MHALNIPCKLETTGDWHSYILNYEPLHIWESDGSLWGDYGIEKDKKILYHEGLYNVANHIKVCLDTII